MRQQAVNRCHCAITYALTRATNHCYRIRTRCKRCEICFQLHEIYAPFYFTGLSRFFHTFPINPSLFFLDTGYIRVKHSRETEREKERETNSKRSFVTNFVTKDSLWRTSRMRRVEALRVTRPPLTEIRTRSTRNARTTNETV